MTDDDRALLKPLPYRQLDSVFWPLRKAIFLVVPRSDEESKAAASWANEPFLTHRDPAVVDTFQTSWKTSKQASKSHNCLATRYTPIASKKKKDKQKQTSLL